MNQELQQLLAIIRSPIVDGCSEQSLRRFIGDIRIAATKYEATQVASTKEDWEVDCPINSPHHPNQEEKLKARRARLLERIQEARERVYSLQGELEARIELDFLQDELAAVEGALGYPEPKEPAEASTPSYCYTCLCLYEHEDPMQSCKCEPPQDYTHMQATGKAIEMLSELEKISQIPSSFQVMFGGKVRTIIVQNEE